MKIAEFKSRKIAFLTITVIYIIAFLTGLLIFKFFDRLFLHILFSTFLADIFTTLIVWFFGVIFKNSSIYDPYWSVAPIFIVIGWVFYHNALAEKPVSPVQILFITAVLLWGLRLTANWAVRWKGFKDEDWRYRMLKDKNPKIWFLTNLVGINLMPTIVVFSALISVYYGISGAARYNFLTFAGFFLSLAAVLLQTISDRQMNIFKKNAVKDKQHIDLGLWKFSRHPNYFGEVLFWWGLWIMVRSVMPGSWITVFGPILMTMLFVFISIPMMESHISSKRPGYKTYKKEVSMIIPWFRFKKNNASPAE